MLVSCWVSELVNSSQNDVALYKFRFELALILIRKRITTLFRHDKAFYLESPNLEVCGGGGQRKLHLVNPFAYLQSTCKRLWAKLDMIVQDGNAQKFVWGSPRGNATEF